MMEFQRVDAKHELHHAERQLYVEALCADSVHLQCELLFIDLDNFKPINDQYGHAAGDAILQQVSARLTGAIRDSDAVSRHGGDEFIVLLDAVKNYFDAKIFTRKLVKVLSQPYQLVSGDVPLSASIGMALFPTDGVSAAALINYADAAMYQAKQQGGNQVCS